MVAGYYEGIVGGVLMRVLDVIFAFPDIVLAIAIAAYLGPSMTNAIWAIGFFGIAGFGRIARAQTLRVTHQDFVMAARSSGASTLRILLTHIWPNIAGRVPAYALVALGYAMMAEAALSFLGLGVPTPTPSWGNIIGTNQSYLSVAPQLIGSRRSSSSSRSRRRTCWATRSRRSERGTPSERAERPLRPA